jgi:hypothetical protein
MRYFVGLLLVVCSLSASALEVVASGFGRDYNDALNHAKINALENVTASWINGDAYVRNGMFSEKITQYNGGVIRSYEVLKNDGKYVVIKADVAPREKNGMTTNSVNVSSQMRGELAGRMENHKSKLDAVSSINDRNKALSFVVQEIRYENKGNTTIVVAIGTLRFQDKWVADYTDLVKQAGDVELTAFYPPLRFVVQGMDGDRVVTNNIVRFNSDLDLYDVVGNKVAIHKNVSEEIMLTFIADSGKLTSVDKFVVNAN